MLGIDSIPEVKQKMGANTDTTQASFRMLNKLIKKDASEKRKEINSIKEWGRRI